MAIYARTFKSYEELSKAVSNKELGDEAGDYSNWIAVITSDTSASNITQDTIQESRSVTHSFVRWKNITAVVYGYNYTNELEYAITLEGEYEGLLLEDGSLLYTEDKPNDAVKAEVTAPDFSRDPDD